MIREWFLFEMIKFSEQNPGPKQWNNGPKDLLEILALPLKFQD